MDRNDSIPQRPADIVSLPQQGDYRKEIHVYSGCCAQLIPRLAEEARLRRELLGGDARCDLCVSD